MTDTIQPRPDPDFLVEMFALLEVPRLAEILAAGDLTAAASSAETTLKKLGGFLASSVITGTSLDDEALRNYCRVAAMWDGPPLRHDGEDLREGAAFHFGRLLAVILSADGDEYLEVDGQPWLRTPYGDRPVTEHTLAHFQAHVRPHLRRGHRPPASSPSPRPRLGPKATVPPLTFLAVGVRRPHRTLRREVTEPRHSGDQHTIRSLDDRLNRGIFFPPFLVPLDLARHLQNVRSSRRSSLSPQTSKEAT